MRNEIRVKITVEVEDSRGIYKFKKSGNMESVSLYDVRAQRRAFMAGFPESVKEMAFQLASSAVTLLNEKLDSLERTDT